MGCARKLVFCGAATPVSARCTDSATPSSVECPRRSSSRSTRTREWRPPMPQGRPTCRSACCAVTRATTSRRARASDVSSARSPARSWLRRRPSARRGDRPRAARRPGWKRAALGHPRRSEGDGARFEAVDRHRRGDRRHARSTARRDRPAELGGRSRSRSRPAARIRRMRTGTTTATTTSTLPGTPSVAISIAFASGCSGTYSARPTSSLYRRSLEPAEVPV